MEGFGWGGSEVHKCQGGLLRYALIDPRLLLLSIVHTPLSSWHLEGCFIVDEKRMDFPLPYAALRRECMRGLWK